MNSPNNCRGVRQDNNEVKGHIREESTFGKAMKTLWLEMNQNADDSAYTRKRKASAYPKCIVANSIITPQSSSSCPNRNSGKDEIDGKFDSNLLRLVNWDGKGTPNLDATDEYERKLRNFRNNSAVSLTKLL